MPIPANNDWTTAIDISSLPYSNSQVVDDSGTTYSVWYKYTAQPGENYFGIWGWGGGTGDPSTEYAPYIDVYVGDGTTFWLPNASSTFANRPINIPVIPGQTYYFKFISVSGNYSPSNLTVSAVAAPAADTYVPLGAIFVNDDGNEVIGTTGYGAIFLSSIDGEDEILYRFVFPFPVGEGGDVLLTEKVYLFEDKINNQAILYDSQLTEITTVPITIGGGQRLGIRANQTTQRFYNLRRSNSGGTVNEVNRIISDGTVTNIFNFTGGADAFAVNDDESLVFIGGKGGGTDSSVVTWNGLVFSTLLATVANFQVRDMLILGDGTLLVMYVKSFSPRDVYVKRYQQDGTLLNTYTLATAVDSAAIAFGYRLAFALDDPISFWAWRHKNQSSIQGISIFENVRVSDGVILATKQQSEFQDGVYGRVITATPENRFGNSSSCPFLIIIEALGSVTPTTGTIIVTKVTVPTDATEFDFVASGGLSPGSFSLADGDSQSFTELTPGDGYSVVETTDPLYTTVYHVSNGTPHTNISVAAGETVTVTVTNTIKGVAGNYSGIYKMVVNKRQDTLYLTLSPVTTVDVKIP